MFTSVRERVLAAFAAGLFLGFLVHAITRPSDRPRNGLDLIGRARGATPQISLLEMAAEIKKGGYILYFRHGNRDKWDSVIAFDIYETATARDSLQASYQKAVCLSPQGHEEGLMIGKIFQLAKVPVGTVVASPICRSRQTAELAFGRVDVINGGVIHTPVTNAANVRAFEKDLGRLLATVPMASGKNVVVTAHGNTLENYPGLFEEGAGFLKMGLLSETGFYVIKRDANGALRIVQRFQDLGVFAANAIPLDPTALPAFTQSTQITAAPRADGR
jgi:phosphohistidine phosphatase SixA